MGLSTATFCITSSCLRKPSPALALIPSKAPVQG